MASSPKWCLELARVAGTDTRLRTWPASYGTGPIDEPYTFLETLELDELQFLRFPPDFYRISSRPSLKIVKKHCQLANLSEIFYRCISEGQWLRTVIEWPNLGTDAKVNVTIHSNVVPSQAYLTRLEGMQGISLDRQCSGGFFPSSVLRECSELDSVIPPRHCEDCALAKQLKPGRTERREGESVKFWFLDEKDVEFVEELGKGSEGIISKILWRKGTFVRKRIKHVVPYQEDEFEREISVALEVSHPNIVHIFGCSPPGSNNPVHSELFMEFLSDDLYRFICEGARNSEDNELPFQPFSFQDLLEVLLQVARAVDHLHEKSFVHGDLKPQNILMSCLTLTPSSTYYLIKVADFGCVQSVNPSGRTVKDFRCGVGTLHYTAPEVLRCRRHGGAPPEHPQKIDVYSFGVVAYQVLTGEPKLYRGVKNSQIIERVIQGQLRPDFDFKGALDSDRMRLIPLIKRCWNPLPESRPSFSEICTEIQALVPASTHNKRALRKRKAAARSKGVCFGAPR